jgi:hypothetical protein
LDDCTGVGVQQRAELEDNSRQTHADEEWDEMARMRA